MSKRLFEILDDMNQSDADNNTQLVKVCPDLISADLVHGGTKVSMGVPGNVVFDLMNNKAIPILLLVDSVEYEKLKNS